MQKLGKMVGATVNKEKLKLKECSAVKTNMTVFTSIPNVLSICVLLVF